MSVIKSCWKHTGICGHNTALQSRISEINKDLLDLEACVSIVVSVHARMNISKLVNSGEEDACVEKINEQKLVKLVLAPEKNKEKVKALKTELPLPSEEKQLVAFVFCKQMCETMEK